MTAPPITPERAAELLALDGYTDAPWRRRDTCNVVAGPHGIDLARSDNWNLPLDENAANARLIAAAPDLHALARQQAAEIERLRDDVERLLAALCAEATVSMRLQAEIERLKAALQDIAKQKKTTELVTACDVEYADFEDGYDMCIDRARAALDGTP